MTLSIEADVLVIGGGLAGCWSAVAAAQAGASVVVAEKGHVGTSGVTATAGPGHWWVPPEPGKREAAIARKLEEAAGLGVGRWMARILEETWRILPTLADWYEFPRDETGQLQYRALRGPEYLRALRRYAEASGVRILDHAPALELLLHPDGQIAGAAGIRTQSRHGDSEWVARSAAVILATGGCAFRSHLLGAANNTGDGLLMAAEAGARLSGMEFSAYYTVAPARTTMTRSMSYAFARYYDEAGAQLPIPADADHVFSLAQALTRGRVFCDLGLMPPDIRGMLRHISPNVMLPFDRLGIDPFSDRFEVTLRAEGTIRGSGGLHVASDDCETDVPGLYAAGDVASRERVTGAASGGGAVNSSWALSSGRWTGMAAAGRARRRRAHPDLSAERIGQAGLRHRGGAAGAGLEPGVLERQTQLEVLPWQKTLTRSGDQLTRSASRLDAIWAAVREGSGSAPDPRARLRARETAAMTATARWCTAAGLARRESRGLHRRVDLPMRDPAFETRLIVSGVDQLRVDLASGELAPQP